MAATTATLTGDDFLQLRERLKQDIRNKRTMKQNHQQKKNSGLSLPLKDGYGSFFGPSLSSIAPRVIQECKVLIQNPNSDKAAKKIRVPSSPKSKAELIKVSRDYSFLFSDETQSNSSMGNLEKKQSVKLESNKEQLVSKNPKLMAKPHGLNPLKTSTHIQKSNLSKNPESSSKAHGLNPLKTTTHIQKSNLSKNPKSSSKANGLNPLKTTTHVQKPDLVELTTSTVSRKLSCIKNNPGPMMSGPKCAEARPKKRPVRECVDDEFDEEEFRKILRGMYRNDPKERVRDDYDDRNMEASFHDIQKEERRSAKIAKKEDAEELQKIMEENKKEMKKRLKK